MKKRMNGRIALSLLFVVVIGTLFMANCKQLWGLFQTEMSSLTSIDRERESLSLEDIEISYNDNFYGKLSFIDVNGFVHKAMGQKLVNGAIRAEDNKLFLESDVEFIFDKETEKGNVKEAIYILREAENGGAQTLYVQRPHKFIEGKDMLPYGMVSEYNDQYDYWCKILNNSGINVLDLRQSINNELDFYKTDHHWTVESSFLAAKSIFESLSDEMILDNEKDLFQEKNYDIKKYTNSFLGSEGVKTGKYYAGKDDFTILVPKFDTDLEYRHYINSELTCDTSGGFWEAFIDEGILADEKYYNKYNACLYGGYVENVIVNNKSDNKQKLLLISDSFSRPMVMYLSLAFHETRYLDPQEGRYNDSYIEYIKEYEPDVVIMMYTGEFQKL